MVYGYFFYPLFTVGLEHVAKIAEAAIRMKCRMVQAPKNAKTLAQRIDHLASIGVFSDEAKSRWHRLRQYRNSVSHPEWQTIIPPGMAIGTLSRLAADLNSLFSTNEQFQTPPPHAPAF